MQEKLLKVVGFWAVGLILFMATMIIIRWVVDFATWSQLSAADLGTWAGSVGTVATLIWTIRLATGETERRKQQERDAAIIAAASMDLSFIHYAGTLAQVVTELKTPVEDGVPFPYMELADKLKSCPTWSREELQPLLYLRNHVAANLAIAQDFVRDSADTLDNASARQARDEIELYEKSELNKEVGEVLEGVLERVAAAFQSCSDLLEEARLV